MKNDEPNSESLPTQRSWMAVYGSILTATLVVLGLGVLLFTSVPPLVNPTPSPEAPLQDLDKQGEEQSRRTKEMVSRAAQMSEGRWEKVPNELKMQLNSLSAGHGEDLFKTHVEKIKKAIEKEQK